MTRQEQALQVIEAKIKFKNTPTVFDNYEFEDESLRSLPNADLEKRAEVTFEEAEKRIKRDGTLF